MTTYERDIPTAFTDAAQAAVSKPIWLVEIQTASSPSVLRFTNAERRVTFPDGGDVYYPRPIVIPNIKLNTTGGSGGSMQLTDEAPELGAGESASTDDRSITYMIETLGVDFRFRIVDILRIERDETDDATKVQQDTMWIKSVERAGGLATFELAPMSSFLDQLDFPGRTADRATFPFLPEAELD